MRKDYLFLASLTLIAGAVLFLYSLTALPRLERSADNGADSQTDLTPLDRPAVSFVNPSVGAAAAPVAVVVFADYLCPACVQLDATLRQLAADPKNGFRYVWKNFPTSADAITLALAGRCAGVQNKFWEYHDLLMSRSSKSVGLNELQSLAGQLNLNEIAFRSCLEERTTDPLVERDYVEGQRLRIDATPYMFIGNRRVSGAIDADLIRSMVREATNQLSATDDGAASEPTAP